MAPRKSAPVQKTPKAQKTGTKRLEELVYTTMELSRQVRDCCRAFNVQALHSEDANQYARCVRSCLELIEVADLVQFLLANSSPIIKSGLKLAVDAVDNTHAECVVHQKSSYCQETCKLCTSIFANYKGCLEELNSLI